MSQEGPGEPILAALRRLVELERDKPIENYPKIKYNCDVVAYYMHFAEWEDDKIENFIKSIQNPDVQKKIRERLEYIPVELDEEDTVSNGTDDEVLSAEEEYDTQMGDADEEKSGLVKAKLDNPPLRV